MASSPPWATTSHFWNGEIIISFTLLSPLLVLWIESFFFFHSSPLPPLPPSFCSLVFGALISAVDPVATLAIFSALDVEPTLHMLVFGESVLNDAVAVVLYRTLLNFIQAEFTPQLVGLAFLQFFTSFFGSALLGIAFSLVSALVLKHVNFRRYSSLEIAVVIVFAYAPYLMAEAVGLSGIMAILFAGIGMSHYTFFNLSPISQITTEKVFRSLAFLAETSVFAYLGLAVPSYEHVFNISLVSVTLV